MGGVERYIQDGHRSTVAKFLDHVRSAASLGGLVGEEVRAAMAPIPDRGGNLHRRTGTSHPIQSPCPATTDRIYGAAGR